MENLIIFLILLSLGYITGTIAEKRHYRSIEKREKELLSIPAVTMKTVDYPADKVVSSQMVYGSAVISIDYFKRILAGLRNFFGGRVKSYESLLDRARREALLRMKQKAGDASMIINVRIETSTVGNPRKKSGVGCLEAIAYGTAIVLEK